MRVFTTILLLLTLSFPVFAQSPCGDVTSITYQGYEYDIVEIGEQCWFKENLRATQYLDGSEIQPGDAVPFANNEANIDVYGLMYGGGVIVNESAVCPSNWHVPSLSNWQELVAFVGANGFSDNESAALRSVDGWTENGNGLDAFGFTGRPGGFHYDPIHPFWGEFAHNTTNGYWWTSTLASAGILFSASLQGQYLEPNYLISNGMSIRCIKDTAIIQGCTIEQGCNYNPEAMEDDNSCVFVGDTCDDGDSETEDDVINADCDCTGTPVTSVSQLDVESLSVYPNPVSDQLTVELGSLQGTSVLVKIFDSQGKLVFDENRTGTFIIDVSTYNTGVYSIRVESESEVIKAQFIVE